MNPSITSPAWDLVKHELKNLVPAESFELWIKPLTFLSGTPHSMTLGVSSDMVAIWVHDTYLGLIAQRTGTLVGRDVSIALQKFSGRR